VELRGYALQKTRPRPLFFDQIVESTRIIFASGLSDGEVNVQWAETDLARNGGDSRRAPNGFVLITLNGAALREEFFDELGRLRWSNF
jgi:hypothetical protein